MSNKIWSPSFNLKHSSSDYIHNKRNQTLSSQSQYTYTNNDATFSAFPSYWIRKSIQNGNVLCQPCPADTPSSIAEQQAKQYE